MGPACDDSLALQLERRARLAGERWDLTPAQARVLELLVPGRTNKEIAARIGIHRSTVEAHVAQLFQRSGAKTRTEIVFRFFTLRDAAPEGGRREGPASGRALARPLRKAAIERLLDAVAGRRHCLVRGESGVGKNCVVRALMARLPETGFRLVYISNVTVGRRDFYRQLSLALGLEPRGTAAAVFEAVQREIRNGWREQRVHPVVIIDEAHLLNDATLSHLHILANFDLDSAPLLSLILVGPSPSCTIASSSA